MSSDKNQAIEKKIRQKGDFEIIFGSSPECDYPLTDLQEVISPRHAALKRDGDRLFLKDLDSRQGTYVNGHRIGLRWHEITLNDDVRLGIIPVEIKPRLLLGRDRVGLYAEDLCYTIPDRQVRWFNPPRRVLTNHVSLHAEPGSLIGIMGPSGGGKTVLLNLLSGYLLPEKGRVMVGSFNVHKSFGLIKDIIGDVPQDDTLIPELTVRQSLHYCLRLNSPDMRADVRENQIRSVLERMGFPNNRIETFLNTPIGSPEKRGLSGGERRRVNIAHELVRNPLLLFLDEPTSGLSSVDSEHVVKLLKEMCRDRMVTMLMTIHQPSEAVFYLLDELLLLNRGGKVAYLGPVTEVFSYFKSYSSEPTSGNPAEYVLRVLDRWDAPHRPEQIYQEAAAQQAQAEPAPMESDEDAQRVSRGIFKKKRRHPLYQFGLLLQRNLQIKLADKMSIGLLLAQVLIISLLLVMTFRGYPGDYTELNRLARTWFHFTEKYDQTVEKRQTFIIEPAFKESLKWADKEDRSGLISENAAQRRVSILFLTIASAIWFGVVNGSREIVSEKYILKRETRSALQILPYLSAKLAILILIAILQTGILLIIICSFLIFVPAQTFFQFWAVLILTAAAASALSLMISAMVKTEQASLVLVPIIIIPQLFLGGLIRPVKYFSDDLRFFTDFILQKWSFKAMLSYDALNGSNALVQITDLWNRDPFSYVRFAPQSVADLFFGRSAPPFPYFPGDAYAMMMILLHGLIPFLLAYGWLKRKYA